MYFANLRARRNRSTGHSILFFPRKKKDGRSCKTTPRTTGTLFYLAKDTSQTHTIVFEIKERKAGLEPDAPQRLLELVEIESKKEFDLKRQAHLTIN